MRLSSKTFLPDGMIPQRCAFGIPDIKDHLKLGENKNPQLYWTDVPVEAKSLVLLCIDPDVPSSMDDFNQEGRTIDIKLPRINFFHWVMVDILPQEGSIGEGEYSNGITPGGKDGSTGTHQSRQGINDYTGWFASDPDMAGDYYGYDGPCPPFNDSIVHHYRFTTYALDVDRVAVDGKFTAGDVLAAIDGHVLGEASPVSYTHLTLPTNREV